MKLLATYTLLLMIPNIINPGEGKPLFFDAITGAFKELQKIFFGNGKGLHKNIHLFYRFNRKKTSIANYILIFLFFYRNGL